MKKSVQNHPFLKPQTFLKVIVGTLSFCIVTMSLMVIALSQPYQKSQDWRQQADTTGLDCNQLCITSVDCAINLRCYHIGTESRCRLALNPLSSTCQEATEDSNLGDQFDSIETTKGGIGVQNSNLTPEPTVTTSPDSNLPTCEPSSNSGGVSNEINPPCLSAPLPTSTDVDQSLPSEIIEPARNQTFPQLFSWWQNLNSPEQANTKRMLIVVLSVGLILVGLALVLSTRGQKQPPLDDQDSDQKPTKPTKTPQSTESINSAPIKKVAATSHDDHKSPTPSKSEKSTPPPSTLTTSQLKSADPTPPKHPNTNQPVPTPISSAQLYPSGGMTARLKQKGVTPP